MKKIKQKFRRLIFYIFKEEILAATNYNTEIQHARTITNELKFVEVNAHLRIDERDGSHLHGIPYSVAYERQLDSLKIDLFENIMKYVQIDALQLLDARYAHHREIKMSLFIGLPTPKN